MKIATLILCSLLFTTPALALISRLQPGGYYFGQAPPGSQVFYRDKPLHLTADQHFILGFGRDAELRQQLTLLSPDGQKSELFLQLEPRSYRIQKINGISKRMMEPSAEELVRIQREAALASSARQHFSNLSNFREPFIWPLKGRISGVYGSQRILNGEPRRPHYGIDIAAPQGSPVIAPAGGTVRLAHQGMFFSGKTLIIDHGFGLSSTFLHLSKILVKKGQRVKQGEKIALVGASGRVTGPHLDWRINWFNERLDPALWVPSMSR
ncbi:M23 family metallopeptidase [Geopsychrobacter electrodiphilus]|uniref:M23 family metallopeptidase n=1 Tax=Geopsychrobacter electrodiphilus TaxID=225196 RepID=UPI000A000A4E|nr:M23 family metallopeptidase [Geopsychrobacter electrodiphilus]